MLFQTQQSIIPVNFLGPGFLAYTPSLVPAKPSGTMLADNSLFEACLDTLNVLWILYLTAKLR